MSNDDAANETDRDDVSNPPPVYRHLIVQSVGDDELDAMGLALAALAQAPDDESRDRVLAYLYARLSKRRGQ